MELLFIGEKKKTAPRVFQLTLSDEDDQISEQFLSFSDRSYQMLKFLLSNKFLHKHGVWILRHRKIDFNTFMKK